MHAEATDIVAATSGVSGGSLFPRFPCRELAGTSSRQPLAHGFREDGVRPPASEMGCLDPLSSENLWPEPGGR